MASPRETRRRDLLAAFGASGTVAEELLAYNRSGADDGTGTVLPPLPLPDEPHVEAWRRYAASAATAGVWETLRSRLPQLQFPVRDGISEDQAYRAATLRGEAVPAATIPLELRAPERLQLLLHPTPAGTVPLLIAAERDDFVALVRAFTARNEPREVPASMGACHVAGYNNWERIRAYRDDWLAEDPRRDAAAWGDEFRRLLPRRELYQDRFIILGRGPYSNVGAADAGLSEAEWLDRSLVIRREHEATHYLTLRLFGRLQNNILEELIADFVGIVSALAWYPRDLALRFLGLEDYPRYREGGRLQNYRGTPPLSAEAFEVVIRLTHDAVAALAALAGRLPEAARTPFGMAPTVHALTRLTLEELAASAG